MKTFLIFILSVFILSSCNKTENSSPNNASQNNETITVSAAISLKDAFDEIGKEFQTKTGKKINFNYGASGNLQRQIENGAPVDVFASAGAKQMDELENGGFIDSSSRRDFAENTLVLIVPKDSKLKIEKFEDLTKNEIKKIAAGNPKTVPAGQYADESLSKMNLQNAVQNKLILAENVRQVLNYVVRGEVDAGIVYATDALTAKDKITAIAIADENTHSPILYPLAILKDSKNSDAKAFVDFVMSADGQNILQKYGFKSAN